MSLNTLIKNLLFTLIVTLFFSPNLFSQRDLNQKFTVILDAGHGGNDSGTRGNGKYKTYEKDVVLAVSKRVGQLLETNRKDIKVIYTRKTDVKIDLYDRPKIANDNKGDLFVSIHCNAADNKKARGIETFVLGTHKNDENFAVAKKENSVIFLEEDYSVKYAGFNPNDPTMPIAFTLNASENFEYSLEFASIVHESMVKKTALRDRGVRQAGFWVLHATSMPSVLIEMGYLSNDKDAAFLQGKAGQDKMASSIYASIAEYKDLWDSRRGDALTQIVNKSTEEDVSFSIQFLSLTSKLNSTDKRFKGLKDVTFYKNGNSYSYIYNKTTSYSKAIEYQKLVRDKGFKDAFIVAFKGDNRISIPEAKRLLKQ